MPASNPHSWRSLLFIPAVAERFVAKAHTRGADVIILDLEDSIPPSEKEAARAALPAAAKTIAAHGQEICVRINRPLELAVPDIAAAIMPEVSALMLPKVMGPEHIKLLSEVERARRLIAAFDVALAEGKGAVAFEGAMIDLPVVERARRLLARVR